MKYVIVILFCLFGFLFYGFGQNIPKGFSKEPVQFIAEMRKYFDGVYEKEKRKEGRDILDQFEQQWTAGKFSEDRQEKIMKLANTMLKFKMRPVPHYAQYFLALTSFINTNPSDNSYDAWFKILEKSLDVSTSRKFTAFLDISVYLFRENVLYRSAAVFWRASSNEYTFSYDSVPMVMFPLMTLTCKANKDSSVISNTKGIYYPTQNLWVGQGGRVTWRRAGLPEEDVYADLGLYRIVMKFGRYSADSVKFYSTQYFSKPLLGSFEDKILANTTEEGATYPRFTSYDVRQRISNIFENIDYEGGFSMHGAKLFGSGDKHTNAHLYFKRDGKIFIMASSREFIVRKDRIISTRAAVSIYWENDSIYHPGLEMKYMDQNKEVSFLRTEQGLPMSPYFDTWHKIDMYCEAVYWKMNEPKIDFTMIKGSGNEGNAIFESNNYFRESRYLKLQGIDNVNPLDLVYRYSNKYHTRDIYLSDMVSYMKIAPEQVKAMLLNLAIKGFLTYDLDEDKIYVKDRLFEYLNARSRKTDYDVIYFNSTITSQPNATLSLLNFDLKLRGVPKVYLSDSQMVYLYPVNQELILKKNRDFLFDGRIHAGLFDFFARECSFDYDKFKLNMPTIDSLSFMVHAREKDVNGDYPLVRVKTVIRELSGDLLIDHPNNKSGLASFPDYPIFNSKNDAYVFYDGKNIERGVYKRDKFFFHVYPFSLKNLDNFKTDDIKFGGYLVSAGIFPDIEEPLKVQADYSLGFLKMTPAEGLLLYGGYGSFYQQVDLSHKGLRGHGKLKYLSSMSESDEYMFYPDSTHAVLKVFALEEKGGGVEYPGVKANEAYMHWDPYKEAMIVASVNQPILMYGDQSKLTGNIRLSPLGLTGTGKIEFSDAEMDAELFKFKQHVFDSDTANFRLKTYDMKQLAFSTHNYKSHIDFVGRKGEFKSNGGGSKVEFPVNQYICFMDEFEWFMDKQEITLSNSKTTTVPTYENGDVRQIVDIDISGSEFVSTHPQQDSLRFFSPKAKYNLRDNIIYAEQVSFIRVADAAIFPEKGQVTIYKEAKMKTLTNAKILANTVTKFHTIENASVNILSRKNFTAVGNYYYVDEKDKQQLIYMNKIGVDSTLQTYATGHIKDSASLKLSDNFSFSGDVKLLASREYLKFKGGYRIKTDCDTVYKPWVKFASEINPKDIYLPVADTLKDVANKRIDAAIVFSQKNNHLYPAFLTKRQSFSDQDIISARGLLQYNTDSKEYRIAEIDKLKQPMLPGNYLSLNKEKCILHGDGTINLGTEFGQVKIQSYGTADYYIVPDSSNFDLVMTLDYFFADNAMKLLVGALKEANITPVDLSKDKYKKALAEILGVKDADDLNSEISLYGAVKRIPSELNHTFVFSDIVLKWNPASSSFVSIGPIGIGNMEKSQINKFVKGYMEITKRRSGDVFDLYLEISDNQWYYFNYSHNLMMAISSNSDFNSIITEMKPEKRTSKGDKNEEQYRFSISTVKKKKDFVRKMEGVTE